MKPINPSQSNLNKPEGALRVMQSIYKAMTGALQDAQPTGTDSTGVYNTFQVDNGSGVMLRIGSSSSSEPIKWVASNTPVVINHGLQRKPIGFHLRDKDKACDVYRTAVPTTDTISLACTDATANVTVYIE